MDSRLRGNDGGGGFGPAAPGRRGRVSILRRVGIEWAPTATVRGRPPSPQPSPIKGEGAGLCPVIPAKGDLCIIVVPAQAGIQMLRVPATNTTQSHHVTWPDKGIMQRSPKAGIQRGQGMGSRLHGNDGPGTGTAFRRSRAGGNPEGPGMGSRLHGNDVWIRERRSE